MTLGGNIAILKEHDFKHRLATALESKNFVILPELFQNILEIFGNLNFGQIFNLQVQSIMRLG